MIPAPRSSSEPITRDEAWKAFWAIWVPALMEAEADRVASQ